MNHEALLPSLCEIARQAGGLIMPYYHTNIEVITKSDASPVTIADKAADACIIEHIRRLTPEILIVSEEGEQPDVAGADYFWLIDPLDGTRSFIRGSGYFTVNIGLIGKNRQPVLGVIYEPVGKTLYYGSRQGAFKQEAGITTPIRVTNNPKPDSAYLSHTHADSKTESWLQQHHIEQRFPCASSIKFCFVAEGKADAYPRFGATMEWDTAAGHAILNAAGGKVLNPDGTDFAYQKAWFRNGSFIACGYRFFS